jgi:hypothetical protein
MPGQCTQLWRVCSENHNSWLFRAQIFEENLRRREAEVCSSPALLSYYLTCAPNHLGGERALSRSSSSTTELCISPLKSKSLLPLAEWFPRGVVRRPPCSSQQRPHYILIYTSSSSLSQQVVVESVCARRSGCMQQPQSAIWRKGSKSTLVLWCSRTMCRWYISKIKMEALTCRKCVYILRQTWSTSVALNKLRIWLVDIKNFSLCQGDGIFFSLDEQGWWWWSPLPLKRM